MDFAESAEGRSAYKGTADADSLGKSGSVKSEFKSYQVWTSSGKSAVRIRKGRTGSPEFWSAVDAAEVEGRRYCGYGSHPAEEADMFGKYQCRACYRSRMIGFTNYKPPRRRQGYAEVCPREERIPTGTYRNDPDSHRRAWDQYRAEDAAKAARQEQRAEALRLLAEFKAEDSPPREKKSTPVEVEQEPDYGLYSPEVAARMAALRKELGIE